MILSAFLPQIVSLVLIVVGVIVIAKSQKKSLKFTGVLILTLGIGFFGARTITSIIFGVLILSGIAILRLLKVRINVGKYTKIAEWVFRSSLIITIFELILFTLWISNLLVMIGDPIATHLMRIGQALSVMGGLATLASIFTRRGPQAWTPFAALFTCVFAFCWLGASFFIGSM